MLGLLCTQVSSSYWVDKEKHMYTYNLSLSLAWPFSPLLRGLRCWGFFFLCCWCWWFGFIIVIINRGRGLCWCCCSFLLWLLGWKVLSRLLYQLDYLVFGSRLKQKINILVIFLNRNSYLQYSACQLKKWTVPTCSSIFNRHKISQWFQSKGRWSTHFAQYSTWFILVRYWPRYK